jgi:hypothetical protein
MFNDFLVCLVIVNLLAGAVHAGPEPVRGAAASGPHGAT